MKNATILRLTSILLILTLMIGMIPAASASNEVYFPVYMGNSSSIVDALRSLDIDPSYQNRERIAAANGIPGYTGTASQNTELLEKLRAGILIDPNGKSTVSNNQDVLGSPYYPTCEENFTSIVDALNSIGVDASFDFRCKIAEANGIEDYAGSAEQNLYMLDLLKSNRLCRPEAEVLSSVADHSEPALTLTGNVGDLSSASVLLDVKKSNAPIRSGAGSKYAVIARCSDAAVLASSGSCRNGSFRKWYKVDLDGETGYIYSGNVSVHKHNEQELHINGVIYGVCNCGMVTAKASNGKSIGEATKVMGSLTLALPLAAADGPLPIGDIAFAVIAVIALCVAHDYSIPETAEISAAVTEADFVDYLRGRAENTCSDSSFRRVSRFPGGLKYLDKYCMDRAEAFLYVQLTGCDVYTANENEALLLAAMYGAAIMERDKARPSKDITTYFYHYHLGTDRTNKAHVFFGLNDAGVGPTW